MRWAQDMDTTLHRRAQPGLQMQPGGASGYDARLAQGGGSASRPVGGFVLPGTDKNRATTPQSAASVAPSDLGPRKEAANQFLSSLPTPNRTKLSGWNRLGQSQQKMVLAGHEALGRAPIDVLDTLNAIKPKAVGARRGFYG